MYNYRRLIMTICLIMAVFLGYFGLALPNVLKGDGFSIAGDFQKTNEILEKDFKQTASPHIIMFYNNRELSSEKFLENIKPTIAKISKLDGVINLKDPLMYPEQITSTHAYALVFPDTSSKNDQLIPEIKNLLQKSSVTTKLTGSALIEDEMNRISQNDLKTAELIGLPVALVVLLLAFGGVIAGIIPIITGIVSIIVAMGICYFLGKQFELSIFVLNITPMLGLALSIDFALLYIHRFREELKKSPLSVAISTTTKTAGRAIVFSGSCVAIGLCGLFFFRLNIFESVAISGITVVFVSVIMANTFLPALLSFIGPSINKMMLFKEKDDAKNENNWKKFAAFVMNRPLKMSLLTLVFLGILIIPMFKIELEVPDASSLPPKNETRIAFEDFQEHFLPKNISSVPIVITTNDESALTDTALRQAHTFIKQLEKDSLVIKVDSLFSTLQVDDPTVVSQLVQDTDPSLQAVLATLTSEKRQLVQVTLNDSPTSSATKKWVKALELDGKNSEENGFYYNIGGAAKFNQEIFDEIFNKAAYSVGFILLSTFLILMFAFRSIAIPLKAVLMNILSLSASFGIIVYIFQFGNFGISPSPIAIIIPVFAFSIVFGLSMDYEVFLISRIQEIYIATGDNDYATLHGLTSTSKIITSAAAIMIAVTGAFTFTDIVPVKQIGLGIAISILIDATIIRMVLVPSLMKLLGKWNWWMPFSKK